MREFNGKTLFKGVCPCLLYVQYKKVAQNGLEYFFTKSLGEFALNMLLPL